MERFKNTFLNRLVFIMMFLGMELWFYLCVRCTYLLYCILLKFLII